MAGKPTKILVELNEDESGEPVTEQPKDSVSWMICITLLVISLKAAGLRQ
jgi:hypothetical protein